MGVSKIVKETAEKIAGSSWRKHIKIDVDELDNTIAKGMANENVAESIFLNDAGFAKNNFASDADYDKARKVVSGLTADDIKDNKKFASTIEDVLQYAADDEKAQDYIRRALIDIRSAVRNKDSMPQMTAEDVRNKLGSFELMTRRTGAYFNSGNKDVDFHRRAAAAGGYAAAAAGVRLMQGGTLIHNEYGERDIAGIPFI